MSRHQEHEQFDAPAKMTTVRRQEARVIARIRDRDTREVVGYLYEWNTGQLNVMWKGEVRANVVYE